MNTNHIHSENTGSNIFLTGTILFANLDYTGLTEYALKAFIGGGIWLMYKIIGDRMAARRNRKKTGIKNNQQ